MTEGKSAMESILNKLKSNPLLTGRIRLKVSYLSYQYRDDIIILLFAKLLLYILKSRAMSCDWHQMGKPRALACDERC